ncbi:hypothetical protein bcere0009_24760 [Bacillus cereus R309803]|nr:hypothetical protein bcere0009_24760 [Bacillus cereus R309803]
MCPAFSKIKLIQFYEVEMEELTYPVCSSFAELLDNLRDFKDEE